MGWFFDVDFGGYWEGYFVVVVVESLNVGFVVWFLFFKIVVGEVDND